MRNYNIRFYGEIGKTIPKVFLFTPFLSGVLQNFTTFYHKMNVMQCLGKIYGLMYIFYHILEVKKIYTEHYELFCIGMLVIQSFQEWLSWL